MVAVYKLAPSYIMNPVNVHDRLFCDSKREVVAVFDNRIQQQIILLQIEVVVLI